MIVRRRIAAIFLALGALNGSSSLAEVGDPTIATNHPHYPGEGVFQTAESCVQFATREATTDHERALALFNWILTHQWHLAAPQEWNRPGFIPGARPDDYEMVVYDANRGRFSYGYGLCGTVHAWNEVYWRALGFPSRRRAFPGHTNSEVFVDGAWRAFDTDMAGVVFKRDGTVAGYDDLRSDLSLLDRNTAPWPKYPFAWPGDFKTMKDGWRQVAEGGNWYSLYGGGYAAHPPIVHLRRGETLTRYYGPDAFGDHSRRRFWHRQPGGPSRDWSFVNNGTPYHDGAKSNARSHTTYGNALFEYSPDLTSEAFREGTREVRNATASNGGLRATAGRASVTFEHFSPYVICGDPVDDANPMSAPATDGFVIHAAADEAVQIEVSGDQGQTWREFPAERGAACDATEAVKGRYGWLVRLSWPEGTLLRSLKLVTTGQLNQAMYPRLRPGGCEVTYRAASRAVVPVLPRFENEASTVEQVERRDLRSSNLKFVARSATEPKAYVVQGPKPASVVFRIASPTALVGVAAAARVPIRSPSPAGAEFALSWSPESAIEWKEFARFAPPVDNEFSSGWVYGDVQQLPADLHTALVRVDVNGGGSTAGLITAELYGIRRTTPPSAATITYGWREGSMDREHSFTVSAADEQAKSQVETGEKVEDRFVRIAVP
jgi:hypothetical protein